MWEEQTRVSNEHIPSYPMCDDTIWKRTQKIHPKVESNVMDSNLPSVQHDSFCFRILIAGAEVNC